MNKYKIYYVLAKDYYNGDMSYSEFERFQVACNDAAKEYYKSLIELLRDDEKILFHIEELFHRAINQNHIVRLNFLIELVRVSNMIPVNALIIFYDQFYNYFVEKNQSQNIIANKLKHLIEFTFDILLETKVVSNILLVEKIGKIASLNFDNETITHLNLKALYLLKFTNNEHSKDMLRFVASHSDNEDIVDEAKNQLL